jgi:hypothetical protein
VSLIGTTQALLFGVKDFLKNTGGYTIKGSCSSGTGAMDGTDRWTSTSTVTPRATASNTSQAWVVLTDGNGADILFTYQGSTDDVARISYSPNGIFVVAGTANNQPTATDELVITSATSLVDSTASADRVWNGWVSSDKKHFRVNIARSGSWVALAWGVEVITSTIVTSAVLSDSGVVFSPQIWGFAASATTLSFSAQVGIIRAVIGSSIFTPAALFCIESPVSAAALAGTRLELQASIGYPLFPLSVVSTTTGAKGKIGNLIDWWLGRTSGNLDGQTYQFKLIVSNGGSSVVWPWDGNTVPSLI